MATMDPHMNHMGMTTASTMNMSAGMNMSGGMNMGGMNMSGDMNMGGMNMGGMDMNTNDGMNMGMGMDMNGTMSMMSMYFHVGTMEYVLFQDWHTTSKFRFAWACIGTFFFAMLYEVLKFFREFVTVQHNLRVAQLMLHGSHEEKININSVGGRIMSRLHMVQTLLHGIQVFLSYCLMLIFMTYNVWLCLSLVLGATAGYFISGWKRVQVLDQNEHCH